jgi:hypothetical protein
MSGKFNITVTDFRPLQKNTLRGFATIRISEMRLEIRDIAIHARDDSRWIQLPARPQLDRSGTPIRDALSGKINYATILEFFDRQTRDAFSHAVIAALLDRFPRAFDEERVA